MNQEIKNKICNVFYSTRIKLNFSWITCIILLSVASREKKSIQFQLMLSGLNITRELSYELIFAIFRQHAIDILIMYIGNVCILLREVNEVCLKLNICHWLRLMRTSCYPSNPCSFCRLFVLHDYLSETGERVLLNFCSYKRKRDYWLVHYGIYSVLEWGFIIRNIWITV